MQTGLKLFSLPRVISHRGAPKLAPENTIASLRAAKSAGAKWVEFDVRLTRDKKAIIFHDDRLDRTTNGKGLVDETDYAEIELLSAGSWFSSQFTDERVPTLTQYLQEAAELDLGINVELKGGQPDADELAKQVVDAIKIHWPSDLPPPLISSFSVSCLRAIRQRDAHFNLGYIVKEWQDDWTLILSELKCISLHSNYRLLNKDRIESVKNNNYFLLAFTVNDANLAERLFEQHVDAIFSDETGLLELLSN